MHSGTRKEVSAGGKLKLPERERNRRCYVEGRRGEADAQEKRSVL